MNKQYAVVLTFPQEITKGIEVLRNKYNKSEYEIVPHITLKMPFRIFTDKKQVIETLNKIAKKTESFEIKMNGISYFENPTSSAVYIALKDNLSVYNLHKTIVFALNGLIQEVGKVNFELDNYIPHITIGESISNLDVQKVKQELSTYKPSHTIFIDSFSLFSADDNLKWKYIKKFKFRKT